jgi:hypothetical protein
MRTAVGAPEPGDESEWRSRLELGEVLAQGRAITPELLGEARKMQGRSGRDLAQVLVEECGVSRFHVLQATAYLHGMKAVDLIRSGLTITSTAIALVPAQLAGKHQCIPIVRRREWSQVTSCLPSRDSAPSAPPESEAWPDALLIAFARPPDEDALAELRAACNLDLQPMLALPEQVQDAIRQHYGPEEVS